MNPPRVSPRLKDNGRGQSSKRVVRQQTRKLSTKKENTIVKPKRRCMAETKKTSTSDVAVTDALGRQSYGLAEFLEKRAEERRQEREADQTFWAGETAKDREFLRKLLSNKLSAAVLEVCN
ncbi:hypothetical protein PRNP1_004518 [Phytophthora ramorum]